MECRNKIQKEYSDKYKDNTNRIIEAMGIGIFQKKGGIKTSVSES